MEPREITTTYRRPPSAWRLLGLPVVAALFGAGAALAMQDSAPAEPPVMVRAAFAGQACPGLAGQAQPPGGSPPALSPGHPPIPGRTLPPGHPPIEGHHFAPGRVAPPLAPSFAAPQMVEI